MNRTIRWYDYITVNIYHLGLSALSQTLAPLVIPLLVQGFVGEAQKGTYYGIIRLWGLMVALLAQALMGILSDRSTLRWGRRRPFIFTGTMLDLIFIIAIGLSAAMSGLTGFWFLFAMYILLQVSSNMAQAAQQGFIPDLVPERLRGRFSGVKTVLEVPLPVILVAFTVARLIGAGNMWAGLTVTMGVLVLTMAIAMLNREERLSEAPPLNWTPFLRLVVMTGVFTAIILGMGEVVKAVGRLTEGIRSVSTLVAVMGATGLIAMGIAVAIGVWVSVRISADLSSRQRSSFTWWVVNRLAYLVGVFNLSGFTVYFLQGRLGFEREQAAFPASLVSLFVGVTILLFAPVGGWLSDRFGHKRIVLVSGLVAALGTLIVVLAPNLLIIYAGAVVIGTGVGLFYAANWALGTELVPREEAARYLGISNLAGAGAGAVGAYIGGPVADYFTSRVPEVPGLGYVVLFAIFGGLFLLSVVALYGVKHESPRARSNTAGQ